jgi:glycosyltransferase involved in cell wall biosynthesis
MTRHSMNYLLTVHIPFGRGAEPGTLEVGDMWLEDLRAQARATRAAGMSLTVATPLVDKLTVGDSGSFNLVTVRPDELGFDYHPLPFYVSMKQYLRVRRALRRELDRAIARCDVVHCGYGGHPVSLGQVAWPIARRHGKKRIWIFDGADPFPRLELLASQEPGAIKRLAKRVAVRRFERFCRDAVRDADLVFAHNAAVVERFRDAWGTHCHQFDRSFVTDANLLLPAELAERQRRLREESRPLRLVAAGRQIKIKGTDHVLRALARARAAGAALELLVMGDGDDLPAFRALAAGLGLGDAVRFTGAVPYGQPLFDAWADAHVMVITNLTAEISRNVLLAMARGLPLVMYSNEGTDALLRQSGAGTIVPQGDESALADAFVAAARDRAALADQAARGLECAARNTLDATHRRRAELAARMLGAPSPSDPRAAPLSPAAAAVGK